MIRCATVSSYMGPYISNYIHSELALERKFQENGDYRVLVFPKDVEDKEWVKLFRQLNAKLYFIEYRPNTRWTVYALREIFKKESINIIHCHFGGWDFDAKLAAPFTPMIWHQRMSVNLDTKTRKLKYWLKYNIAGAFYTRNIAISKAVYIAISSITRHRVYCIPNAIEFSRLKPLDILKEYAKGLPYNILLFGYTPLIKGLDIAYQACEILNSQGYNIKLRVVSQSVSDKYIADNYTPLPNWFEVLPPSNNVAEYYNDCNLFLSASRSEGFSNSLLEAIYSGCPAVYSDIAGTRWADDFENTFMYEVESPPSLANAIIRCMNTHITNESKERNRELAVKEYGIDKWVNNVYEVLTNSLR